MCQVCSVKEGLNGNQHLSLPVKALWLCPSSLLNSEFFCLEKTQGIAVALVAGLPLSSAYKILTFYYISVIIEDIYLKLGMCSLSKGHSILSRDTIQNAFSPKNYAPLSTYTFYPLSSTPQLSIGTYMGCSCVISYVKDNVFHSLASCPLSNWELMP